MMICCLLFSKAVTYHRALTLLKFREIFESFHKIRENREKVDENFADFVVRSLNSVAKTSVEFLVFFGIGIFRTHFRQWRLHSHIFRQTTRRTFKKIFSLYSSYCFKS